MEKTIGELRKPDPRLVLYYTQSSSVVSRLIHMDIQYCLQAFPSPVTLPRSRSMKTAGPQCWMTMTEQASEESSARSLPWPLLALDGLRLTAGTKQSIVYGITRAAPIWELCQ